MLNLWRVNMRSAGITKGWNMLVQHGQTIQNVGIFPSIWWPCPTDWLQQTSKNYDMRKGVVKSPPFSITRNGIGQMPLLLYSRSPWGHLHLGYSKIWLATRRITVESNIDISEKLGQWFIHNFNSNMIYACNLTQEETILLQLCQGAKGYCNMKGKFPGCKGILVSRVTLWKHDHHNSDFATSWKCSLW